MMTMVPSDVSSRNWSTSLLSQTPVNVYREPPVAPDAPKRRTVYLGRTQTPPSGSLHEEWPLAPWMSGSWGYVFKCEPGELWSYQLAEGEELTASTPMTVLSLEDWCVLRMLLNVATSRQESWS